MITKQEMMAFLGLDESDIRVVCGALRQNVADRTKWDYITTTYHEVHGVTGVSATAIDAFNINVELSPDFSKVLFFSAHPDEWMASKKNITVGCSVGPDSVQIQLGGSVEIYSELTFNSATKAWTASGSNPLYNDGDIATSWDDTIKQLTISHSYCPELNISVESMYPANCFAYRRSATAGSTVVGFADGAWNSATPANGMKIIFRKVYNGPIQIDGSANSGTLNLELGNLWFYGLFRA